MGLISAAKARYLSGRLPRTVIGSWGFGADFHNVVNFSGEYVPAFVAVAMRSLFSSPASTL